MKQADIQNLFSRLAKQNPAPTTELEYRSEFELLISVILSAQATDVSVNKATNQLFQVASSPKAMLELGADQLKQYIRNIGLFNTKALNILKTCELLLKQHAGTVPRTRQELQNLPGVGRKTANVILNTAFGEPVIAVDTHIFRVSNRTGVAPGKNVAEVEKKLMKRVPKQFRQNAHHWLILHGRYVCTARKPKCDSCMINDLCDNAFKFA